MVQSSLPIGAEGLTLYRILFLLVYDVSLRGSIVVAVTLEIHSDYHIVKVNFFLSKRTHLINGQPKEDLYVWQKSYLSDSPLSVIYFAPR